MRHFNELNKSKYGNPNDFIEIIPREIGNELLIDICRVTKPADVKCINVVIRGDAVTIKYDDNGERRTIHCSI